MIELVSISDDISGIEAEPTLRNMIDTLVGSSREYSGPREDDVRKGWHTRRERGSVADVVGSSHIVNHITHFSGYPKYSGHIEGEKARDLKKRCFFNIIIM